MKGHLRRVLAVSCLFVAGCYEKTSGKDGLVFTYQTWVPLLVGLAGLAAIPVGILLFVRRQRLWGVAVAVGGPLVAVAVAPGMYLDRVVVNQDGFYSRHGFWWDPVVHQVRYDDLSLVRVVVEEKTGRRGRKTYSYYFDCFFKSGKQERVPLGDVMREALPEIAGQFEAHGVPVQLPPNLPE